MKYVILILLLLPKHVIATDAIQVHVIRSFMGDVQAQYVIPFEPSSTSYEKKVWRSPDNIDCKVILSGKNLKHAIGAFTCTTPEQYKLLVPFNCAIHTSKDRPKYFYFGKSNKADSSGDFYVWCE